MTAPAKSGEAIEAQVIDAISARFSEDVPC